MSTKKRDPLLLTAKIGTVVVRAVLVAAMIAIGIVGAVSIIDPGLLAGHVTVSVEQVSLNEVRGGLLVLCLVALVSLALMYDFTVRLGQVIDTVGMGDPFTLENASRLRRMAWLAIAIQLVGIPATLLSTWLTTEMKDDTFEFSTDISLTGFALAIVLFILARVFRTGAEMREELEGTV